MLVAPFMLVLLGAPPESPAGEHAGEACDSSWHVHVVDANTKEGVPRAEIELRTADDQTRFVRTDARGEAHVAGLCPGKLRVSVSEVEHSRKTGTVELAGASTDSVIGLEALHEHHSERVIIVHDDTPSTMADSEHLAGAELAATRGQGLADAISSMSGVTTLRGSAGGMAKPVIRGQIGRRNLIIFDGVRHEGQKWGLDHAPEIDPNAAGRITVIKGAATTAYGPDAIGGVVLVDPRPLPRAPGVAGEVGTFAMTNGLGGGGMFRLDHAPARAPGFAWRVDGNYARNRAFVTRDYPLDNTGAETWNVGARLGYLGDRVDVVAGYRLLRMRAGICTCLRVSTAEEFAASVARSRPVGADLYTADFALERPRQEIWHHLAMARMRADLGRAGELHATYAFQFNDREEYEQTRESVTGPQLSLGLATHTGELRYEHAAVPLGPSWTLVGTIGADVNHQVNRFDSASTLVPDYQQVSGGLFAVERFVSERLELELGARHVEFGRTADLEERDYLGQRAAGRLDVDACSETADGGARCRQRFHAPSATLGLLARPSRRVPELALRLDLNSSARTPAVDESYMNGAAPSFPLLGFGDSHLKVERTWGASAGLSYLGDWLRLEGSGFANYIDQYIYFQPQPQEGQCAPLTCTTRGPFPVFAFTSIDALFVGGEVRVDVRAPRLPLELSGDASWVRAWDLTHAGFVSLVPADRYGLRGRWLWPDTKVSARGYLEIGGTFVARQRRWDPAADFAPPPSAFVLLGGGVGVEFPRDELLMRLSLRGTNLLNARYREYTSLLRYFADEPGWGLQLRFAVEFS
jgi:iron complex outermembrane receptor protein